MPRCGVRMLKFLSSAPNFFNHRRMDPGYFWQNCLFWSFWLSLALFPIGYGFREVMPLLCLIFLCIYYRHAWRQSTLHRLGPVKYLFLFGLAMILIGIIFSIHPLHSLLHAGTGINKAFILPFIAMECATGTRQLRLLCWACVLACFWEGLDGLWQAFTGFDFIMNYPYKGRLTGSLGDYTVGNYLALAMIPAFGIWHALRRRLPAAACCLIFFALFWPAAFLFIGASSRSAILAVGSALALWGLISPNRKKLAFILLPALAAGIFLAFEAHRFAPDAIINDNRWDLWKLAWKVFAHYPWLGAGAGQYNAAFRSLGLAPAHEVITISHPHNLYLDILYAHGLIGFACGAIFIFGFLAWGLYHIARNLNRPAHLLHWQLTAWFGLGYFGWLVNGIFGHDFYRIWWLALSMCNLGVMIGGIVNSPAAKHFSHCLPIRDVKKAESVFPLAPGPQHQE